jgi:hypothetical protein
MTSEALSYSQRIQDVHVLDEESFNPIPGLYEIEILLLEEAIALAQAGDAELRTKSLETNLHMAALFASNKAQVPGEPLTENEIAVLHLYTQDSPVYRVLNARLRSENRDVLRPFLPLVKLLLTAIYKLPQVSDMAYRGVPKDICADFEPGKKKVWWAMSSSTKRIDVLQNALFGGAASGPRTMIHISTCAAFDISPYSAFRGEDELLLAPGSTFQVIANFSPAPNLFIIQLKQLPFVPLRLVCEKVH